jgi:hypothetical protein
MIATRAMTGFVVVKSPRWDGRGLQGVQERLLDPWQPRLRPMNCRRLSKFPRFSMFGNTRALQRQRNPVTGRAVH